MNVLTIQWDFSTPHSRTFLCGQEKRFLLLDETLDGLDVFAKRCFFKLLKEVAREGKGVLLTTHDLDLVTQFADKVVCWVVVR